MQSACFCSSGSTLKPCLSILTPPDEPSVLMLSFDIQDRNGYSLPKNQTPMVLPLRSAGFLMPVVRPAGELEPGALERLGDVDERHALLARRQRRGHPVDDDVGAAAGDHLRRRDVGPAGIDGDVEAGVLVVALGGGDVIAGELRLGDPFELERDLVGGGRWIAETEPSSSPAAIANVFFMLISKLRTAESGPVGRVPEGRRTLGERDNAVERHAGDGRERDLGPHHVE